MPDFDRNLNPILLNTDQALPLLDNPASDLNAGPANYSLGGPPLSATDRLFGNGPIIRSMAPTVSAKELYENRRYATYSPDIIDIEDQKAYAQSGWNKAANGLLKGLNLTATTVAGGFGMLYGLAKSPFTGRLADIFDNDVMRGLDAWNNKVDQEYLPNYYTNVEKNAKWYSTDNWFKTNFLFDKLIKNAGFAVGAMVGGNIANAGFKTAGAFVGELAMGAAEASQGFKLFTPLLKNTARAFSVGKNVEVAAALESEIASIADLTAKTSRIGQIAQEANFFGRINDVGRRTAVAAYSSAGESSFEALQTATQLRENLINKYKEDNGGEEPFGPALEEINQKAESAGKAAFFGNLALLSATEFTQLPYLLGSSYRADKMAANSFISKADDIALKEGKWIAKETNSNFAKIWDKARIGRYVFDPKEAGQELGQYALQVGTQNYYNKAYEGQDAQAWTDGFLYGFVGKDESGEGVGALVSKEGMESLVLGGLTGGLMQSVGQFKESRALSRNTQGLLNSLNDAPTFKQAFKERLDAVNRGVVLQQQQQDAVVNDQELEAKDLKADMLHNYLAPRIKYGRFDLVMDDLQDLKREGLTEGGLASLKEQGLANINDTIDSYQQRLGQVEAAAKNTNELYSSLNLRFGGVMNPDGTKKYPSQVIDKMIYAASKIADYDVRIPQLSSTLSEYGVSTAEILNDIIVGGKPKQESLDKATEEIFKLQSIDYDDVIKKLDDTIELSYRRKLFLNEFNEMKTNPDKYIEKEVSETPTGEQKETVSVKTKDGDEELEVGQEYFLGKVVEFDKNGKEVYRFPKLTILGENEDGTIKIKDSNGRVRDVSKDVLADYKLGRVSDTLNNKKAKFYMEHANTIYEFNFGKGRKVRGRLEYAHKEGVLNFVYKNNKGEISRIEVTGDQFVPKKGFNQAMITPVGQLTAIQKAALDQFTAEKDKRYEAKRAVRLKILNDLFDDVSSQLDEVQSKLASRKAELEKVTEELAELEKKIAAGDLTKKNTFKSATNKAIKAANKLSRLREDLRLEIETLQAEQDTLEFNLSYVSDMAQNIDELPTDSEEFLGELKTQVNDLESLLLQNGSVINDTAKLMSKVDKALKDAVDFAFDLINKFEAKYPNLPIAPVALRQFLNKDMEFKGAWPDYQSYLQANPNLLNDLMEFDRELAEIDELDVIPNERTLKELGESIEAVQKDITQIEKELRAKRTILDKFEDTAKAFKAKVAEENRLAKNKELIEQAIGTAYQGVQIIPFNKEYEANRKKSDEIIPRATAGVMRGKPHQIRANTFGFNLNRFPNRKNIRGVYVTSKNEDQILPGLTDRLRMDEKGVINEDISKDNIIALVMVEQDANGNIRLVGENGQPIPEGVNQLDAAIYQVFPDGDLKWGAEFNNQSMFRKDTPKEVVDSITEQYKAWRKSVLKNPSLDDRHKVDASFGTIEEVKDANGNTVYETRTSVEDANLITPDDLEISQLINIPTTNTTVSQGTVAFTTPLGRVFLELPNGLVKLQNRQHTKQEAETIFQAILQQAKYMMDPKVGLKDPKSERLFNWLRSVTYWGIPTDQDGNVKEAGYNSIFWEVDENTGKFMLSISGKGKDFLFTPTNLEQNKDAIVELISNLYNNVNNSMSKQLNEPYEEILSISEDGEVTSRIWKNYQSYLLSTKTPDGKTRSGEEIPLTTLIRPAASPEDVNRTNIYFFTADTADDFVIPVVEKKKVTPKTLTPGAPKTEAKPKAKAKGDEDVFRPGDEEAETGYVLDGKTVNTYVSPKSGNRIKFKATTAASPTNLDAITVVTGGEDNDIQEIIETIKKAGKDPKTEILNQIYKAIAPQIEQELQEESDEETFTVSEDAVEEFEKQTGSKPSKSIMNILNKEIKGLNGKAMRVALEKELKNLEPENWNQVETWLKSNFPNIPVFRVKNMIKATNGRQAWGMFKDGAIYIYENAEVGTAYHEVFHAVWRMFTDGKEQKAILDEMRSRGGKFFDRASLKDISYKEATDDQLEEKLAEEFRDYVQFKKIPAKPEKGRPFILKLFADLVTMIKEFFLGPQSASKVEDMFSKIGKGYYKSHIPYQTSLSFAKEGVIDIEDAFASSDAVLSLDGITDKERADIINHMTYLTLLDVIKTDRSLFNIEKRNKKEVYAKLKEQILQTVGFKVQAFQNLVTKGLATQEEVTPMQAATMQLMQKIDSQWDLITERHEEFLKAYSIEFDENDQITLRDENNSGRETYQDATKIDNFKKANSAIKLLLATIPVVDNEGNIEPSSIGGAKLLPSTKTYISLMNNLHTSGSVEEMVQRLREMASNDPNYRTLYERITKKPWIEEGVDLSNIKTQHGLQLLSAFWGTFKKQAPEVKNVFILENGEVVVGDANLSSAGQQLRSEYINAIVLKARSGEGYFTYDERKKIFKGDPKKVAGVELDKFPKTVSFLNKMGVPFTISDVNKMNNDQKKAFREAVSGIRESISNTEEIATFSGKVLNINKRLLTLGLLKSAVDNPEFSSTFFNVSGERTQTYIGTNAVSDLAEFIGKLDRFNKDTVGGTKYNYLLTDSFAKGSNLMSRIFSSGGVRKKDTEDLLKVGYVSGMVNEEKGKRKESSRLTYKDRLVQELNLNIAGWYLNLVPGDASIEHMVKMGNAVSLASINRGMLEVNEIFKQYFMSELALARENRPVAKGRKSKEMRFFKNILGEELHNAIMKDSQSVENVYDRFADRINTKLAGFIKKDADKFKQVLTQYGILTTNEKGYTFENIDIEENLNDRQLDNHLTMLSVNYMIANIELHKLLYSDPYQYEDELKRIKSFNSPRQAIINNSPKMNAALDSVWNRGYDSKDIGFTKFTQDYFRSATHADVIGIADLPGYQDFKETDGSGIINFKALRQFRIRAGNWNDNEELQYKYDIAWEKNDKGISLTKEEQAIYNAGNPQVKSAYTPLKPIVSGSKLDKNGLPNSYNSIVLDKFALYPLSYRIMKEVNSDSNAVKLYNKMQREDIDYVVFTSGRKVGAEKPHKTYINGEFNDNPYDVVINVPFSIMSIQSEVPSKEDNLVTRGSQITKLVTLDFMEAGVPVDFMEDAKDFTERYNAWYKLSDADKLTRSELYREIKNNQDLLEALTEWGYKNTLNKLGIKEITYKDPNGFTKKKFEIVDRSKAVQTLREEILKREVNDNISDALAGFLQGKVVIEATPAYQQVRNIIYSIADKGFISPKINGGMKVQIPSTFLESGIRNVKDGLYESDVLKFYEKDGKRVAEVMLGRWFDSPLSDEELLDYLNKTEEGQKILAGVGYRIPTQKQNSVDAIVIKKFLPKEFGDSVVVPAALIQKVGSDFDIDKLSVYLKNVYVKNGKPQLIPYFGIGEQAINKITELYDKGEFLNDKERQELERYIAEEQLLLQDVADDSLEFKLINAIFGKLFSEQEITESFTRGIPAREQIINQLYKKSLENAYIQNMENLITHPKNYSNLIKPNSVEDIKELANEIAEKTVGQSFDYKNVDNMLDRTFMSRLRHAFVTGKYAIGIAAVNQTNHSLNQRQPIYIDKGRLSLLSPEDREWIGNADIKFKDYNRINIDDRMVPTLSMIENADGENISDLIGKFIDGYVDISKGPWIMELGATPNVASTWLLLIKLGIPIKSVAYFMNQPIIRDYLRMIDSSGYSWLFIDDFVDVMASSYSVDLNKQQLKEKLAKFTIPSEKTLENNVGKSVSKMSPQERTDQFLMLNEFLKYAKMGEQLFLVTQGSNYDTSTFNDPYLVFKKQMQQIKAQQTIINSVDTLLANSFIGNTANTISETRDAFAEILPSDQKNIRNVIQRVLAPYITMNDRDFVKLAQKAVNDLFDWAVQTDPDQGLNKMIKDILVDDGGVSKEAIIFANKVKSDPDHPLYDNQVINIINSIPSKRAEGGANNIKLEMGDTRVYDQNNVIYAFRELRDYMKGENNPLYNRIKLLAILQSGLSASPISFTSLLPHEDFESVYNKTLVKINSMPTLDAFYNLGVFQRNNWSNDDVVPYLRAKRIISKTSGRKHYNPAMKFLPDPVKQAIVDEEIPPVMTLSMFNREAASDYIVYVWEKELELLTPEEIKNNKPDAQQKMIDERKAQMRKIGDYSYINKGLFKKVYDDYGTALEHTAYDGKKYFVYKAINAWGDSFRANEFWDVDHQSQLENGFVKVEDVDNNVIIGAFLAEEKSKAAPTQVAVVGEIDFQEEPSTGYKNRTIKNASADATIALAYDFDTAGERLTKSSVTAQKKQYIAVKVPSKDKSTLDLSPTTGAVTFIVEMLNEVKAKSLNIAGNGLYTMRNAKYTQEDIDTMTYKFLKAVVEDPRLKTKITSVRTGGQTGFDEAGAKAAIKLGIPTTILAPKGWAFRNKEGVDVSNEQQFKARFANIKESKIKPKGKPAIDNRNQKSCR